MDSVAVSKKELRKDYLAIRSSINEDDRVCWNKEICKSVETLLKKSSDFDMIAVYITDGTEVDLTYFINSCFAQGIKVCVPRFNSNSSAGGYEMVEVTDLNSDLELGYYNIMEPKASCREISDDMYRKLVWLVPGVVFDENRGRLGRGKGVYDQMLKSYEGINIGIFYECQKTESVPVEDHDRYMDVIVTEKKVY